MKANFDVLILGGGMVGAALACALGDSRLKVALLDRRAPSAPADDYDRRVSAITLASRNVFRNLGVWDGMQRRRLGRVETMEIWEDGGTIRFDAADIGEGELAYIVENSVIQQSLLERLSLFTNVSCLWPVEVVDIKASDEAALVTLKDGRALQARLIVGADGAESATRRAVGIDERRHDVDQKGIVATVRTENAHERTAYQRFLPTGPLAFLPLDEPNASSIVWSADTARADMLMTVDDAAFTRELQAAFGERLGDILSVSRREAFSLSLAHARAYISTRVALVGDAAHTVHPLAGQGVNLGLLDAAALAQGLLDGAARGRDIGERALLRRYERARKADNLTMVAVTGGFKYFFGNTWPALRGLRNAGFNVADKAAPLKRMIMRRAAGLDGDLPELARIKI